MFIYKDLANSVYTKEIDADEFDIISGYLGPSAIDGLLDSPYKCNIYIGMYGRNVDAILHKTLIKYANESKIEIHYTSIMIHSKCYIWSKNTNIVKTLIGSANFSTNGLYTDFKETLSDVLKSDFEDTQHYLRIIKDNSINIKEFDLPNKTVISNQVINGMSKSGDIHLSLLASRNGTRNILNISTYKDNVPTSSGINWGFSNGLPKPNDAYFPISQKIIKDNPGMFQAKGKENIPVDVIWDDGTTMKMLFEGTQPINGVDYPKQLASFNDKSLLGKYLRKRIGKKINQDLILPDINKERFKREAIKYTDKLVTREHLESYGRLEVVIKKIQENTYYLDFSTK